MTARRRRLDRIAITYHNTLTGAIAAHALDPELVIIGEEIMTTHEEILGMYVSRMIPPGLSPEESIKRLRDQGVFISISHPFDSWRSGSWKPEYLLEIISQVDAWKILTLVAWFREVISGRPSLPKYFILPGRLGQTPIQNSKSAQPGWSFPRSLTRMNYTPA